MSFLISLVGGKYFTIGLVVLLLTSFASVCVLGRLYSDALLATGELEVSLNLERDARVRVEDKVMQERDTSKHLLESETTIEELFTYIEEEVRDAEVNDYGVISTDAVADILCTAGLATAAACDRHYSNTSGVATEQ